MRSGCKTIYHGSLTLKLLHLEMRILPLGDNEPGEQGPSWKALTSLYFLWAAARHALPTLPSPL